MKTVFTNAEITHIYASRTQDKGSSNSMSFEGDTFYSYNQPIGQFVDDGKAILLERSRHSVTTSAHQSNLYHSVSQYTLIEVGEINRYGGFVAANKEWYESEIAAALKKAARAKTSNIWHLKCAQKLIDSMKEYVRIFKLDWEVPVIPADLTEIKKTAQKEAAEESAATKRQKAERAEREAEALKEYIEHEREWLRGENWLLTRYDRTTLLRIKGDEVETSRGAKFPIAHAKRGLALVRSVMKEGADWYANGHTLHLGPYTVNRITKDGTVYAGCHVVPWSSIENIAPQLEAR